MLVYLIWFVSESLLKRSQARCTKGVECRRRSARPRAFPGGKEKHRAIEPLECQIPAKSGTSVALRRGVFGKTRRRAQN